MKRCFSLLSWDDSSELGLYQANQGHRIILYGIYKMILIQQWLTARRDKHKYWYKVKNTEMTYKGLGSMTEGVLRESQEAWVVISLHILYINALSDTLLPNIFSHSVCWLLILLMVSPAVQKLLSFSRSHLFLFLHCFSAFWLRSSVFLFLPPLPLDVSKDVLLRPVTKSILLVFSSRSFMASGFCIWCEKLVHFDCSDRYKGGFAHE